MPEDREKWEKEGKFGKNGQTKKFKPSPIKVRFDISLFHRCMMSIFLYCSYLKFPANVE
jgi:hypothetical protein